MFFFSSRRRHTRLVSDWSSDVCSSDLPPLTNQYLNLTKNSSLAVAIGYPDLFSVFAGTTLSQTGQAIEIIAITMGVYLLISLVTSAIMSFYGWRLGRSMG